MENKLLTIRAAENVVRILPPLNVKKNEIDGSVLIQVDQTEEENFFLLNQATNNSFIKGVVGWINLRDSKLSEKLDYYSQNPIFKGVRHIVQSEKDNFF